MEKITYEQFKKRVGNAICKDTDHYFLCRDESGNAFWVEFGHYFDRKTNRELNYYLLEIFLKNGNGAREVGGVTLTDYADWQQVFYKISADLLDRWKRKQKQNKRGEK